MENISEYEEQQSKLIPAAFQAILAATEDFVFIKDMNLVYVAASMPFVKMTGKNRMDEVVGKKDAEIFESAMLAKKYAGGSCRHRQAHSIF